MGSNSVNSTVPQACRNNQVYKDTVQVLTASVLTESVKGPDESNVTQSEYNLITFHLDLLEPAAKIECATSLQNRWSKLVDAAKISTESSGSHWNKEVNDALNIALPKQAAIYSVLEESTK